MGLPWVSSRVELWASHWQACGKWATVLLLSTPVADGQLSTEVSWTLVWGNWGISAEPRHPEDSSALAGGPHPPWRRDLAVTLTGAPSGSVLAWKSRALEKNGDTKDTPPHPRLCCPWFHLPMVNRSQRILNRKFQK